VVLARLNVVTLGARDLESLRGFYLRLGWALAIDLDGFAAFETSGAVLTLFPLESLAADANVPAAPSAAGMGGFSLAINVDEPEQVDETIEAVRHAGGRITKEPADAQEFDGRTAYFADPEGNLWEVACVRPDSRMAVAIGRATGTAEPG